jgi:hypothetical protein
MPDECSACRYCQRDTCICGAVDELVDAWHNSDDGTSLEVYIQTRIEGFDYRTWVTGNLTRQDGTPAM